MLIPFLDAELGSTIYVNPEQVSVVFEGTNPEGVKLTLINMLNGNIATTEDIKTVISKIEGNV